jgi:hypothetical protein
MTATDYGEVDLELGELIELVAGSQAEREFKGLPAKVTTYDPARQVVDCQPVVLVVVNDQPQVLPVAREVQVRWEAGAKGSFTFPLQAGDFGWIKVAGADISQWKASGAEQAPPNRNARGSLSDVIFEPGTRPLLAPLDATRYAADGAVLFGDPFVYVGDSTATDFVALAAKVLSELQSIKTAYDLHVHPAGTPNTGAPLNPLPAPSSVAATKAKAK